MELACAELRMGDAIDIAFGPAVVQVPLQAIIQRTAPTCNYRLACIILNIKNLKPNARKPIVRWGAKTQVVVYDRLFLCRDVSSGETFYILSEDAKKTALLLSLNRDVPYIGSYVVVYQPRSDGGLIYDVPIVQVNVPLIPATPQVEAAVVTAIKRDFVRKGTVESFLIEIADLVINEATVVPACASDACDGRHSSSTVCPGLGSSSTTTGRTFAVRLSSAAHQLDEVVFRSTRLAGYFLTPALLQTDNIKYTSLQGSVMAAMAVYTAAEVTWLCQGYYKLQEYEEEERSRTKLRVYISRLEPRGAAPANIVLYDGVEAAPVLVDVPMLPAVTRDGARLLAPLPAVRQQPAAQVQQPAAQVQQPAAQVQQPATGVQQPAATQQHATIEQQRFQRELNLQGLRQTRQRKKLAKMRKLVRLELRNLKRATAGPIRSATAPGGNEPAPGGNEPAPGGNEPAPGGNEPAPGSNEPAPGGSDTALTNVFY